MNDELESVKYASRPRIQLTLSDWKLNICFPNSIHNTGKYESIQITPMIGGLRVWATNRLLLIHAVLA